MSGLRLDRPADRAALTRLASDLPPHPAPATREQRLARDPLPFIPPERQAGALASPPEPEAGPFEMEADDPAFRGQGWWQPERTSSGALRWAGFADRAALLLPALGGGALDLTLAVRSPFGIPLDITAHDILLDGAPLTFATEENDGVTGRFTARAVLPAMPPLARVTLMVVGGLQGDPDTGPRRDTRLLGLGLMRVRLVRA